MVLGRLAWHRVEELTGEETGERQAVNMGDCAPASCAGDERQGTNSREELRQHSDWNRELRWLCSKMTVNFKLRWQNDACTNRNGEVWRWWFCRKEKSANQRKVTRQSMDCPKSSWSKTRGLISLAISAGVVASAGGV